MKTILLSLRNIFRNKRRTAITFMAIISGMTGIIVFGGFVKFTYWGLRESTIKTQLGHVQIYKKGYSEKGVANPNKYLINNPEAVEKALSVIPDIKMVSSRLTFSGLISTGEKTLTCKGIGIAVEREEDMSNFETIVDGSQLEPDMTDGGVVGIELMKALGAKVGDYLTILTTTTEGAINALDFKVAGVAQTGSQDYDSVFVKLPIKLVQRVLDTDSAEKIIVLLNDTDNIGRVVPVLEGIIKKNGLDLEYRLWSDLAIFYNKVVQLYNGIFGVIKIIIGAIVLFSIANTMNMSVFERVREIGTLRAIGTTRAGIMRLFISEGILVGIIGGLFGIAAGILIAYIINLSGGIYIPPPPNMNRGYIAIILIVPEAILYAFISTVIVSALSSIYPAYKASRLKVVEALGHV
ncbi:MAG: ABC transporter permease [Nitrospinae bacterium]|nr:ABC transporter permease [Nitrospinota bacterium]